jgi:hypothetical protein
MSCASAERGDALAFLHGALDARQDGAPVRGICCATWELRVARSNPMLDLIMLAIGLGFFVLSVGYAYACERL